MKIRWNGHASFTLTTDSGKVIVTDPFAPEVGYPLPGIKADVVTISHSHFDHNYTGALESFTHAISDEGEYEFEDVKISAIPSWHDDDNGAKRGSNLLFKITVDGKTVVHLGDLGHLPSEEQAAFISACDVLLIPIGGTYTITTQQAIELIKMTRPKTAIPMHFKTDAIQFPITDEKEFANIMNAEYAPSPETALDDLPACLILPYK